MQNNLNTYRILFLVKGILTLVFSFIFIIYAVVGGILGNMDELNHGPDAPPFNVGALIMVIGIIGFVVTVTLGTLTLFASKYLNEKRKYTFIFVMAIVNCITGLLGILLCIFTLIELSKPHVKELFNRN